MEKTYFRNDTFLALVIAGILGLLIWNVLVLLTNSNYLALIPIGAQTILLILILAKHKYAKIGIKIWAILMIVGSSLSILGKTIQVLVGDDIGPKLIPLIFNVVLLFIGLTVNHYNNTTVVIETKDKSDSTNNVL